MDTAAPPQYSRRYSRSGQVPTSTLDSPSGSSSSDSDNYPYGDEALPAYSRRRHTLAQPTSARREPTEHVYQLNEGGNGKPWVVLRMYSSAKSAKSLPTFFEKENVNAVLEMSVDRGDSIHAIEATVTGRIITGSNAGDSFTFLNQTTPIWAKNADLPRVATTSPGAQGTKLLGDITWTLSIPLPQSVMLPVCGTSGIEKQEMHAYKLPETFLERHTRASVQYDFKISIARGKLRSDSQIKTAFGYVPSSRPEAPSMLRQLAYQQACPIPGPEVDSDGWKTLRPVSVRGTLSSKRQVEAKCILSLARPLCYTRGTPLPCHLSLSSADREFLNLISSPSSINVVLRRRVRYFNKSSSSLALLRHEQVVGQWTEDVDDIGKVTWWPTVGASNESEKVLQGELELKKDMRPTSAMGHFSISYSLVMAPFKVPGFTSSSGKDASETLLSEPVEIATSHAKGPRAVAYTPPSYDAVASSTSPSSTSANRERRRRSRGDRYSQSEFVAMMTGLGTFQIS